MQKWQIEADKQDKAWMKRRKKKKKTVQKSNVNKKQLTKIGKSIGKKLSENATPQELKVKNQLDTLGIKYIFQKEFIITSRIAIVDFFIPCVNLVIEIDGFHHYHDPQKSKDRYRQRHLLKRGIKTMRFNNKEVDEDPLLVYSTILAYIQHPEHRKIILPYQ